MWQLYVYVYCVGGAGEGVHQDALRQAEEGAGPSRLRDEHLSLIPQYVTTSGHNIGQLLGWMIYWICHVV